MSIELLFSCFFIATGIIFWSVALIVAVWLMILFTFDFIDNRRGNK